jgi:hypothetical protein
MTRAFQTVLAVLLIGLLTACGGGLSGPNSQIVKQAIALEVNHTQTALSQKLRLSPQPSANLTVSHVVVKQKTPLKIENLPGIHLQGTYDVTLKVSGHPMSQHQNDFNLYLQQQAEGKNWRLARLQPDGTWSTEMITPA